MDLFTLNLVLDLASTTDNTLYATVPIAGEWELDAAVLVPNSTLAAHAANYRTTSVTIDGSTVATQTTNSSGGATRTVGAPQELALSNTHKWLTGKTDVVTITSAHAGSGAVEDCTLQLAFRARRSV